MGIVDSLHKEVHEKSTLKNQKKIGRKNWHKGDLVICRMEEEIFKAEIFGFYENSAVVYNIYNKRLYCCSFRNMLNEKTQKPLKPTPKHEAVNGKHRQMTAYLPTDKERAEWKAEKNAKKFKPKTDKKYRTILS